MFYHFSGVIMFLKIHLLNISFLHTTCHQIKYQNELRSSYMHGKYFPDGAISTPRNGKCSHFVFKCIGMQDLCERYVFTCLVF